MRTAEILGAELKILGALAQLQILRAPTPKEYLKWYYDQIFTP